MPRKKKELVSLSDHEIFAARAKELFKPIDQQIMMCDNIQDSMALASVMLNSSARIFVNNVGYEGAALLIEDLLNQIKTHLKTVT